MVTAGIAREQGFALYALTIDYNQRHRRELEVGQHIAANWACGGTSSCRWTCGRLAARR